MKENLLRCWDWPPVQYKNTQENEWRVKMDNLFAMVYIRNPQWKIWQGVK